MEDMRRGLDFQKAEAAFKRAAEKAIHGTREERSGRFNPVQRDRSSSRAVERSRETDSVQKDKWRKR
jgi:hypothetical protein